VLEDVVFMGADYWAGHFRDPAVADPSLPPLGVGENVVIRRAIVDKNARIGEGSRLVNNDKHVNYDGDGFYVRDGVIVVPKNGIIKPGTEI
jgi:glucose-1-phosphate adenylyltransferase